jgi:choice-of-anchor C domain-containing protein
MAKFFGSPLMLVCLSAIVLAGNVRGQPCGSESNLIKNGGLESGADPGRFLALDPGSSAISDWVVTRSQIDYIGYYWISADGSRSCDLDGSPGNGGIAQSFSTTSGCAYQVSFFLAGNPDVGPVMKYMRVEAAGQHADFSFDTTGRSSQDMGWQQQTWAFAASDSLTTLEFYSLDSVSLGGPALDGIAVIDVGTGGIQAIAGQHLDTLEAMISNAPNPFTISTAITVESRDPLANGRIEIYDTRGRLVRTISPANTLCSRFEIQWDGQSKEGLPVASGIYYYRLLTDLGSSRPRPAVLLR